MPLSYGSGIRTVEQVSRLLSIGYEKVCVNTALVENPEFIREAAHVAGSHSVVASIATKGSGGGVRCVIRCGGKAMEVSPVELAKRTEALRTGEIFLNSIDRDGVMKGYDLETVREVAGAASIPVTDCGGAGGIPDCRPSCGRAAPMPLREAAGSSITGG